MMRWVVAAVLLLLASAPAAAVEQRCTDLGADCVCHNDFTGTSYSDIGGGFYARNPANADSRSCGVQTPNAGRVTFWTSGGGPTAVIGGGPNGVNVAQLPWIVINEPTTAQRPSTGRFGARYYIKLGSGYESTSPSGTPCQNDKYIQISGQGVGEEPSYHTANQNGFYWNGDGGGYTPSWTPASRIGHWIRMEMYVNELSSLSRRYEVYMLDLTTGETSSRTNLVCAAPCGLPATLLEGLHRYRALNCAGTYQITHLLMARWSTNAGQRIGAATEVETGGPVINHYTLALAPGPYAVTGTDGTLTRLPGPTQIGFIHTAAIVIIIVAVIGLARFSNVD
jgi:hypothetical protein